MGNSFRDIIGNKKKCVTKITKIVFPNPEVVCMDTMSKTLLVSAARKLAPILKDRTLKEEGKDAINITFKFKNHFAKVGDHLEGFYSM